MPETLQITWFDESPDAGPGLLCSLCGLPIGEHNEEAEFDNDLGYEIPIRMWSQTEPVREARFHDACFRKCLAEGIFAISETIVRNRIPRIYLPPTGGPANWADESSGELPAAVRAWWGREPLQPEQLGLLIEYCDYYIHAPCFAEDKMLEALRVSIGEVTTSAGLKAWLDQVFIYGLDPL